jgi:hypothetical protein
MTKVTGLRAETSATPAIATLSVAVAAVGHVLAGGSASLQSLPQLLALAAIAWSVGEHVAGRRWRSISLLATLQLITHLTLELPHRAPSSIATAAAASAASSADRAAVDQIAMDHAAMGHGAMAFGHSSMHAMAGMAMPATDASAGGGSGSLADAASGSVAHAASGSLAGAAPGGMPGSMHSGLGGAVTMSAAHLFVLLLGVALVTRAHRWAVRVVRILARLVPQVPVRPVALPGVRAALVGVPEMPRLTQRWLVSGVSRRGPPEYGVLAALY